MHVKSSSCPACSSIELIIIASTSTHHYRLHVPRGVDYHYPSPTKQYTLPSFSLSSGMRQMQQTCRLPQSEVWGFVVRPQEGLQNGHPPVRPPSRCHCSLSAKCREGGWPWGRGRWADGRKDGQQATGAATALQTAPNISIFKGLKPTFLHSSNLPDYVNVGRWP